MYPEISCNYGWPVVAILTLRMLITLATLSFATAFISVTVTKSKFFAPLRDFFFNRALSGPGSTVFSRVMDWIYELISCTYCFSHWVAIAFVAIYHQKIYNLNSGVFLLDMAVLVFLIVGLSSFIWGWFFKLSDG